MRERSYPIPMFTKRVRNQHRQPDNGETLATLDTRTIQFTAVFKILARNGRRLTERTFYFRISVAITPFAVVGIALPSLRIPHPSAWQLSADPKR